MTFLFIVAMLSGRSYAQGEADALGVEQLTLLSERAHARWRALSVSGKQGIARVLGGTLVTCSQVGFVTDGPVYMELMGVQPETMPGRHAAFVEDGIVDFIGFPGASSARITRSDQVLGMIYWDRGDVGDSTTCSRVEPVQPKTTP